MEAFRLSNDQLERHAKLVSMMRTSLLQEAMSVLNSERGSSNRTSEETDLLIDKIKFGYTPYEARPSLYKSARELTHETPSL